MKNTVLVFALSAVAHAYDLRVPDQGGTYEVQVGGKLMPTKVRKPCTEKFTSFTTSGYNGAPVTICGFGPGGGGMFGGNCAEMEKIYSEKCMIKVFDADSARSMVDQSLKGGVDSLIAAVKGSYNKF